MKSIVLVAAVCASLVLPSCSRVKEEPAVQKPPTVNGPTPLSAGQREWIARAWRHQKEGWVFLHCEGSPRERGFQHGYLLAKEIDTSLRMARGVWKYETGMEWSWGVGQSKRWLAGKIDAELLEEMGGIAEGMVAAGFATTADEIVAYNSIIELQGDWWPHYKEKNDIPSPTPGRESCSSFIATGSMTATGEIVLGHNTMCSYTVADCYVILDLVPDKGHRILMQASPGWIHSGTDFFITSAGLVGAETTIGDFHGFDEDGIPEFVRMRRATQDASSIDRWCEVMKKGNNGGYANAWLLGDIHTNEIARLEMGLKHVGFERTKDGYYAGSNLAENLWILRLETEQKETDIRRSGVTRRLRWKQLMKQHAGSITLDDAKAFEADHYDTYLRRNSFSWRALCAHAELDSIDLDLPFEPAGTVDAKVVDSEMAREMSFAARWGSACGRPFDAAKFLEQQPQFEWMKEVLQSRASYAWAEFKAGER